MTVKGQDGRHHPATELASGDYFGEIALLDGVPRNADVRTVENSRLYKIDRDAFLAATAHYPGTGFLDRARHRTAQTVHIAAPLHGERDEAPDSGRE